MTINQLRSEVYVTDYSLTIEGVNISYLRNGTLTKVFLTPLETVNHLHRISSIDEFDCGEEIVVTWDDRSLTWAVFVRSYGLSQWDALNIAINEEYSKEVNNSLNALELEAAIQALK